MKRSKQIFVAVVLVLSVVLSLKFGRKLLKDVSSTKEALPQPDVAAPLPSHKQTSLATTNFIFQWGKMGDVSTYRVRYSIRVVPANGGNFDVSATINNATIKGYYHVRVLKSSAEDVVLGTQFSHTEIRSMERAGVLEQFLNTTPVAIRFSRQGQILGYRLPDKASAMDRQFLMGMNCFQIVLEPGENWTANETDGAGEYSAVYTNLGKGKISKQKLKYILLRNASPEQTMPIVHSSCTALLGPFWLDSYRGKEISKLTIAGTEVLTSESEVELVRSQEDVQPPSELKSLVAESMVADAFSNSWSKAGSPQGYGGAWAEQERANTKAKYENVSFQQVYTDLLDANKRSTSHAEHLPSILALKDWLGVHPEGAKELSKVLSDGELPKELTAQLVYTLELSGANEMSQQVLADLLDPLRGCPESVQVQDAVAAGGIQNVSPSLYAALLKTAFDPPVSAQDEGYANQNAALLALGAIARNNQTIANTLADNLILNLQDPTINANTDLAVVALLALKNGAIYNPDLLTAAQSLLVQNKDEHVRMAALDYLTGSKEDNLSFIEGALNDPVDVVRIKSLELLTTSGNPSEFVISSALNILRNPKESEQLRMAAVDLLSPCRTKDVRVSSLFQQIQTDQPESTIALRIEQTNK